MTTLESAGADQEIWHVEVGPNDVRPVTLDQLDQAFQDGLVNESTRVWQEGMPCAMTLGELLGGDDDEAASEPEPEYAQHEYAQHEYAQHEYAQQQYSEPQYAQYSQPQYSQPQYSQPQYAQAQYAPPQYLPPKSAPPPSRAAAESSWPPVVARSETPPPVSVAAPPSMAPMALDVPDFDVQYPRRSGKGKFLLAAFLVAGVAGAVAVQKNGGFASLTATPAAAATQAPAPPPPPVSHAYDPGPPVKLGESKPPLSLTVREPEEKKADDKKLDDKKLDAKKVMASGKKPKAAPRRTASGGASKPKGSSFKLGKSGSKYDPLNGSL